ncbi:MAG: ABC transporter ATP-binding protein/permease, partial [Chloroflexaceae bacterium]|nr:ABC transporter ATP-binding protein/permease [Chloroflexaceae bacterium]
MTISTSSLPGQRDDIPAIAVQPERRRGLMAFVARRRVLLTLSGLSATLGTLLGLVPIYAIYQIALLIFGADRASVNAATVLWLALACVGAALARGALIMGATSLSHTAAYDILYDMRIALAGQLARLPLGFFSSTNTGTIKKVIHEDVEQMEEGIAHLIPDTVSGVLTPLATLVLLLVIDWRMALATLGSLVLAIGTYGLMMNWAGGMYRTYNALVAQMNAAVIQYINGMKVIKAFTQTDASFAKLQATIDEMEQFYQRMQARVQPIFAGMLVLVRATLIVLLPVGIWLLLSGSLDVPTFVLFLVASMGFNRPIFQLFLGLGYAMYQVQAASARIAALLNAAPLPEPAQPREPRGAAVAFQGVSFAYGETPVLSNVSFSVPEGSVTALVGPSGAGKTTVARLIPRFWDVSVGSITVGGVDVRQIGTERLMEHVAFVFQDVFLFNDTVRENIRVGKPGASDAEVEAAALAARCHEFITGELPQGYDTRVGENGGRLSGGQRQRLSVARAILKDAPIVVLDEATAFVDPENEGLIQEALSALLQAGKTLIIVAHRLSTITGVDQILVVDEGRIAARGTHDELLQHSPLYAQLWQAHVGAQGYEFRKGEGGRMQDEAEPQAHASSSLIPHPSSFHNPYVGLDERDGLLTMIRKLSVGTGTLLRDGLLAKVAEGTFVALPSLLLVFILVELLGGAPRPGVLWALTVGVLVGYLGQYLCARVGMRTLMKLDVTIQRNLRLFLADYMRRLPLGFFTKRDVGTIDALFTTHIQFLETRLVIDLTIIAIVTPTLVFLNMLAWDWRLALAAAAGMPLALLALRAAMGTFARVWRAQSDARTAANSRMVEYIQGIPVIRAFNLGGSRLGQFQQALDAYRLTSRRTTTAIAPSFAIFITVVELGFAALVVLGATLFAAGSLEAATFLLLLVLASAFAAPLLMMGDAIAVQRIMQNSVRNVNAFLRSPLLPEAPQLRQPEGFAIQFDD